MAKSLKKRIDRLFNALGEEKKPTNKEIRNCLSGFSTAAEELENSDAIRKAKTKITTLEKQKLRLKSENDNLKSQLQTAKAEIDRFRDEQKERAKKDADLPDILFEILKALPSISETMIRGGKIADRLGIEIGDVDLYLSKLEGLGYATRVGHFWQRNNSGNAYIMAKRLAGEEDAQKTSKHADLPKTQHHILLVLSGTQEGVFEMDISSKINKTLAQTQRELRLLRKANMATDGDQPQATYGLGQRWWLMEKGEEYLDERELL